MKAKFLPGIVLAIAIIAFGLPNSAQNQPDESTMRLACADANWVIPSLIENAPYGAGWVNRTQAWFENLFGLFEDLLSVFFDAQRHGEHSKVGKSVNHVNFHHLLLHYKLRTIMNADGEVVEEIMPSKLRSPTDYIIGLKNIKMIFVDPACRLFLG